MKVTYIGHACMMMESAGTRILMDSWLSDPTYHGSWWHYPPLVHRPEDLPKIDYLYISHEHPDHFDPPTLKKLDKNIHIVIADFKRKRFVNRIRDLGFDQISEIPFGEEFACEGSSIKLRLIPPDRPWDDSAILVKDHETTVLNVNDCHLDDQTLAELGQSEQIDLAFLTFTGASQYPGCFDLPEELKVERWQASKKAHVEEFVNWAKLVRTKRAVPAAGNYALLDPEQVHLNTSHYVNTPQDAIDLLQRDAPEIEGLQMNPGDVWTLDGGHQRHQAAPDWEKRMDDIRAMSADWSQRIADSNAKESDPPENLFELFREFFSKYLHDDPTLASRVGITTWWQVDGPSGGDWVIDFTRDKDWIYEGIPEKWNLKLNFPGKLVYQGVSGQAIWDNLVLSFRARLARNPDEYMKEFWTWLCKI